VSPAGRTRTLPASDAASVRLAVFSCSLYPAGHFNVYEAALAQGADYALHLGDYIYEYGADPAGFGNGTAEALGRVAVPSHDIVTLDDYRARYAQVRSDDRLQALHAAMPLIAVWDDHEFANNAWVGGAENHDPATQGDWATRKAVAARVWHEWMPVRSPDPADLLKIYRRFDFGHLFTLHMLDTRIEGRARQYDNFGDADGGYARYGAALASGADAGHPMISAAQFGWLQQGLARSQAAWQLLGNQDIMARMWMPASVLRVAGNPAAAQAAVGAYLGAKATRAAGAPLDAQQTALLDPHLNPLLPYNLDAWDGYPLQREALLRSVAALDKRLVTLSGDSHNAWFTHLSTLTGQRVGVEFAGSSVTSPGFESVGLGSFAPALDGRAVTGGRVDSGLGLVDDLAWADASRRGWLRLEVTTQAVTGEFWFVDGVATRGHVATLGRRVEVDRDGHIDFGN
jgi:alkaline phosphatase D